MAIKQAKGNSMPRHSILAVDDNKTNLQIIKGILESDYDVMLALSGEMALRFIEKKRPDLVLLDLRMPGMSGREVFERIHANPDLANLPVFFLTADMTERTESECLELGAADFVTKPIVPLVLKSRIAKALELVGYQEQLQTAIDQRAHDAELLSLQAIEAIVHIIDARDEETNGHSRRVAEHSRSIAVQMGLEDEAAEAVYRSALLHDVGKIGIPDAILKSDKPLTNDQYDLVKTHTTIGANILSVITTFEHLPEGARYHHERYDGSGYPEGLSGNDIPLIGRIVAVADVYDAMTSKRRYKDGIGKEEVLAEMERDSGTKFDPTVVEAFIRTLCE